MADDYRQLLEEAYVSSIKTFNDGEIVKGTIVDVRSREVVIDIGHKAEGIILRDEFYPQEVPPVGTQIEVYIETVEDEEGRLIISYEYAKKTVGWTKISTEFKENDLVDGIVSRKVKGGFMVNVFGCEGFLPGSLSTFRNSPDKDVLGHEFNFQIVKLSKAKQNFILSRKDAIKYEREIQRGKIWDSLKIGETRQGRIKSITDFGAFIDLGGVDGLLHIADMSWKKINHPSEVVAVGDQIDVMILNIDKDAKKLSLGLKQLGPDPWQDIEEKYSPGSVVNGKVVNILNYGVFIELEKGIEGLVHVSELSWGITKVNLQNMFAIGDIVEVKILNVDAKARKISLSIKQLDKDPWERTPEGIEVDSKAKGKVIGFTQEAAFVELSQGIEGIVYTKDLSWTKRATRPQELLKKNHTYEFKILEIDKESRRVVVGLKQLKENPWDKIIEQYPLGSIQETEIVKITEFGVFVKLQDDLEGLIFEDEIDKEYKNTLSVGDTIKAKIIKIDPKNAKIGLSAINDQESKPEKVEEAEAE